MCAIVLPVAAGAQQGGQQQATPVETQEVTVDTIDDTISAVGTILSNESVIVRPELAGVIARIGFEEGEHVEDGALLFELDDSIYQAELAEAQARLNLAQRNFKRADELLEKGSGTARARDEALSELEASRASVALAEARLEKTKIHAPFAGITGLRRVSQGAYVIAGQELVNLESIQPVKVDFTVPERYLASIETGLPISVQVDAYPERRFEGEVMAVDPRIDEAGRSISVRALIENPEGLLRPGLFARVALTVDRHENALLIPEEALMPQPEGFAVYKVVDGKVERAEVKIGMRRGAQVEIIEGLAPGDVVITAGQIKPTVRPGAAVQPIEPPASGS